MKTMSARLPESYREDGTSSGRSVLLVQLCRSENYQFAAAVKVGGTTCKLFITFSGLSSDFTARGSIVSPSATIAQGSKDSGTDGAAIPRTGHALTRTLGSLVRKVSTVHSRQLCVKVEQLVGSG